MYRRQRVETQKLTQTHTHIHMRHIEKWRCKDVKVKNCINYLNPLEFGGNNRRRKREKNTADCKRLVLEMLRFRSVVFCSVFFYCLLYVNTTLSKDYVIKCNWVIDWVFKNGRFFRRYDERIVHWTMWWSIGIERIFRIFESEWKRSVALKLIRASSTPFLLFNNNNTYNAAGKNHNKKIKSSVNQKRMKSTEMRKVPSDFFFIRLKIESTCNVHIVQLHSWTC